MTKKLRSPLKTLTWLALVLSLVLQPVLQVLAETGEGKYAYEVKYEDFDRNKLHKTKKEENNTKATLEKKDYEKKIVGYKLNKVFLGDTEVEAKEITLVPAPENKILLIYKDDPDQLNYEYEVEYVGEDGKKLAESEKKQIAKDAKLDLKDLKKEILPYGFKEFKLEYGKIIDDQVFIDRGGQIIKLVYEKNPSKYPYEIKYEDLDGKELHKTKKEENNTKSALEKQDYAKEIDGYKLNKVFLGRTEVEAETITLLENQENKIKLVYEKLGPVEKVSYRASYLDENNNKLRTDIQGEEDKGSQLNLKNLEHKIDGYSYKETKLDGQVMTGKTYQLDRDIRLELIYKKDKVEKEYTIKLINKYMDNTDNTIEEKTIVARAGDKINLREVFTPKTRSVSHIGDIEFDQEEIYLGTSEEIAANAAVRTTYKLKFNEEELVLDGYIGQEISLPKEISGYSAPTASTIILAGIGDEKPAYKEYISLDPDAPAPLIKELEIKYEGPDNESLSQAEKLKTLDGISMKLKPKSIFGYASGEVLLDAGPDKLKFSYSKKDESYEIRLVDRDANPILDRQGLYIQEDKTGKIGQVHSLGLSTDQVEDLRDYTYPASFTLGQSPYIGLVATKKSTGGGGGGGSSNSKVDYKIIHEDRDGKELDVEKGRGWIGEEIKAKKNHYKNHTFYRAEPKDEKIRLVVDEKKNIIRFIYEKDRDKDSGSSSSGGRGSGSSGGSSSSSSLPKLNKDQHIKYIYGYEDGSIRPGGLVSREEAAMMIYRLVDQDYSPRKVDFKPYKDLDSSRWSYEAIKNLTELGILTGYEDGSFKPTRPMTRAELVVMMSKFEGMSTSKINKFNDSQNHWASDYINSAADNKWINGYEDGSFRPDKLVTRAEFVNVTNKILDRRVEADGVLPGLEKFSDLRSGSWYYYPLVEASNGHDYRRYPNGREDWTKLK